MTNENLIEQIGAFLALAPNGNPRVPGLAIELLERSRAALEAAQPAGAVTEAMVKAACAATVLGENEDGKSVHLEPREARQALVAALEHAAPAAEPVATHRHKKRGSEYVLIGVGKMQSEMWEERGEGTIERPSPLVSVDMREVILYQSTEDQSYWVRPAEEFLDGRFEEIAAPKHGGDHE